MMPSVGPTLLVIAQICTATFSDDYLSVFIVIAFNTNENVMIYNTNNKCDDIFLNGNVLLGNSECINWDIDAQNIHDNLIISLNALTYVWRNNMLSLENNGILPTNNPIEPIIVIETPLVIGICDNLIRNAASTKYLGGRSAIFKWIVNNIVYDSNTPILIIDAINFNVKSAISVQLSVPNVLHYK